MPMSANLPFIQVQNLVYLYPDRTLALEMNSHLETLPAVNGKPIRFRTWRPGSS